MRFSPTIAALFAGVFLTIDPSFATTTESSTTTSETSTLVSDTSSSSSTPVSVTISSSSTPVSITISSSSTPVSVTISSTSIITSVTSFSTSTRVSTTSPSTSTVTSATPSSTPCIANACFTTKFNSHAIPAGDVIWLSAVFKPKFPGPAASVSFTSSTVMINGVFVSIVPDSFIELDSSLGTCDTADFLAGTWQSTAPLPGSGNTFLSAVSIPVPANSSYAKAEVTWCGDITAPGEVAVQIAAAVYTSCSHEEANPEACETHTDFHAGVPTGCLDNLVAGGTGGGGSNYQGSLSATYAICRSH